MPRGMPKQSRESSKAIDIRSGIVLQRMTEIEGVRTIPLTSHADERGSLTEIYRQAWLEPPRPMVQANLSVSAAGVLRGLHFHREQADLWVVVSGSAFVGLFDLRTGSPTEGRSAELELSDGPERVGLYIPPGVAHGFLALTELSLLYLVDRAYTGDDELGLAWDDPAIGIAWPLPVTGPIVSERDRSNPALAEVRRISI